MSCQNRAIDAWYDNQAKTGIYQEAAPNNDYRHETPETSPFGAREPYQDELSLNPVLGEFYSDRNMGRILQVCRALEPSFFADSAYSSIALRNIMYSQYNFDDIRGKCCPMGQDAMNQIADLNYSTALDLVTMYRNGVMGQMRYLEDRYGLRDMSVEHPRDRGMAKTCDVTAGLDVSKRIFGEEEQAQWNPYEFDCYN